MKKFILFSAAVCIAAIAGAQAPAAKPTARTDWAKAHSGWYTKLAAKEAGKTVDIVVLGDSINMAWQNPVKQRGGGKEVWDEAFGLYSSCNFAMAGDRTEHLLWRITAGKQLDGYKARVVVLQIGINNGHQLRPGMKKSDTPREAAEGVKAVLKVVMQKQPGAKIILLGVFPAHFPSVNRIRWAAEINKLLQVFADGEQVIFKDFGKSFLKDPAHLKTELFIDGIHLSKAGFEVYAKQLAPVVKKYLPAPAPRSSKSVSAGKSTDAWCKFVATLVKKQQGKDLDILFAGDLHLWGMAEQQGKEAFKKYFGDRKTFNIAYINQRTENLLYQFRTYKHLEGLTPKLVVLQTGISNLYVRNMIDSIPAAAYGVRKVLKEIRKAIPNVKILLLGVTPVHYPGRNIIAEGLALDQQLAKLADGKTVFYKSVSGSFLKKDKTLDRSYYVNGLMLNKKGYDCYIRAIRQECDKLLAK